MNGDGFAADTALLDGAERRTFGGRECLSIRGEPVYGKPVDSDDWRTQDAGCSKPGVILELGMDTGPVGGGLVLYLGAASETTVLHTADFTRPTYAVKFAPRPVRDLVSVAEDHDNPLPLLKDARDPDSYAHAVEADIDCFVVGVTTRGQATVAIRNRQFLASDDRLLTTVKARSEDAIVEPGDVFDNVIVKLDSVYELPETVRLDRFHANHLGIITRPE